MYKNTRSRGPDVRTFHGSVVSTCKDFGPPQFIRDSEVRENASRPRHGERREFAGKRRICGPGLIRQINIPQSIRSLL
jgi:hypothetical protein